MAAYLCVLLLGVLAAVHATSPPYYPDPKVAVLPPLTSTDDVDPGWANQGSTHTHTHTQQTKYITKKIPQPYPVDRPVYIKVPHYIYKNVNENNNVWNNQEDGWAKAIADKNQGDGWVTAVADKNNWNNQGDGWVTGRNRWADRRSDWDTNSGSDTYNGLLRSYIPSSVGGYNALYLRNKIVN